MTTFVPSGSAKTDNTNGEIKQWVSVVTNYSSQWSDSSWSARQVVGPPTVYPRYGDINGAWATRVTDAQQFIELEYAEPVFITGLDIYETFNAGGVKAIYGRNASDEWHLLWKTDQVKVITKSRIFSPPIKDHWFLMKQIRIEVDCTASSSFVEIDAVQLRGKKHMFAQTPIRLVGGASPSEGRVEVFHNNTWGTVCDDDFDTEAAMVVCGMLGLQSTGARPLSNAYYGQGYGTILLDDVRCTGNETDIDDCIHSPWDYNNCGHNEDVGVQCRPTGSAKTGNTNGEIKQWVSVVTNYSSQWDDSSWSARQVVGPPTVYPRYGDSGVWCVRVIDAQQFIELEYAEPVFITGLDIYETYNAGGVKAIYGRNPPDKWHQLWKTDRVKVITKSRIFSPPIKDHGFLMNQARIEVDCTASRSWVEIDAVQLRGKKHMSAQTPIRLVGGASPSEGRVEVFHNNTWGTVCDDNFETEDAMVVCGMLGLQSTGARQLSNAYYGQGYGTILLDDVGCTGNETDIDDCIHSPWAYSDCGHNEDVGVQCRPNAQTPIRLVGGASALEGRLEVFHNNMWGTVCDDSFNDYAARVVCNMLGYPSTIAYSHSGAYYGAGNRTILLDDVECTGIETDIDDCRHSPWANHNCAHNEDVGVQCVPNTYNHTTWYPASRQPYQYTTNGRPTWYQTTGKPYYYSTGAWYPTSRRHPDQARQSAASDRSLQDSAYYLSTWYSTSRRPYQYTTKGRPTWYQTTGKPYYYTTGAWYPTSRRPYYYSTGGWYPTSIGQSSLEQAIHVRCNGYNGWDIRIDMNMMRTMYPNLRASHLYLGRNSCTGQNYGSYVMFRNSLGDCGSSQTTQGTYTIFKNELLYAVIDPSYSFIIRHYNWTMAIDCVVSQFGAYTAHKYVQHPHYYSTVSPQSLHTVGVQFYQDPNFMVEIPGNPLNVTAGTQVYVKVFTTDANWGEKMVVHDCYSEPASGSPTIRRYNLIRNGCEVDASTHIISQSMHETKFVFEEFEYALNKKGVYLYCDARFCATSDYSQSCQQRCQSFG